MEAISLNDFRKNDNIVKVCYNTNEPIFLTQDGENDMVLMSAKTYAEYKLSTILNKLNEGIKQADNGEVLDGEKAFNELIKEYER